MIDLDLDHALKMDNEYLLYSANYSTKFGNYQANIVQTTLKSKSSSSTLTSDHVTTDQTPLYQIK